MNILYIVYICIQSICIESHILFCFKKYKMYTVDLVILARFKFLGISRVKQMREFKNAAKIVIIIIAA